MSYIIKYNLNNIINNSKMSANQKKPGKKGTGPNMVASREPKGHGQTSGGNQTRGNTTASSTKTKESFQKKLLICQKTYDYKDESKDVKGKTERLNAINEI